MFFSFMGVVAITLAFVLFFALSNDYSGCKNDQATKKALSFARAYHNSLMSSDVRESMIFFSDKAMYYGENWRRAWIRNDHLKMIHKWPERILEIEDPIKAEWIDSASVKVSYRESFDVTHYDGNKHFGANMCTLIIRELGDSLKIVDIDSEKVEEQTNNP